MYTHIHLLHKYNNTNMKFSTISSPPKTLRQKCPKTHDIKIKETKGNHQHAEKDHQEGILEESKPDNGLDIEDLYPPK